QLALARRDRARLARLVQAAGSVQLQARGRSPVGTIRPPAAIRSVEVLLGGRRVGRVVVGITLDAALLDRLAKAIQLPAGDRLVFRPTKAADGTTVRFAGSDYRVVGATLLRGRHGTSLLVATPESRIDAIAAKPRQRVLIAGLITLGTLVLPVYAFAPALARGRLSRQQRD